MMIFEYGGEFKNHDWAKHFTPDEHQRYQSSLERAKKKKAGQRPEHELRVKERPISSSTSGIAHPIEDHHIEGLSANEIHDPEHPSFPTGSHSTEEIGEFLHKRGSEALKRLGVKEGAISGPHPHTDNILVHTLAHEVKGAMKRGGKVGTDWYTTKFKKAMKAASDIYP